jgi:16S rRNA (cytidine1402-2'-O)-methyltransferase
VAFAIETKEKVSNIANKKYNFFMAVNNIDFKPISKAAGLYIVSTPIGNMADITIRALQVLAAADVIYCEDTRQTKKLLVHYGINSWLEIYNDHNAAKTRPKILENLNHQKMVALVTDAGTPLVSDPGYKLVREVIENGHRVVPIPGASAMLAALVGSGMASDQFHFAGFVDDKKFDDLISIKSSLIFYESPKRLVASLKKMSQYFAGRSVCIARELTKIYEEFQLGNFEEVIKYYTNNPPKGEVVILLSPPDAKKVTPKDLTEELRNLLRSYKLKEASEILSAKYGISKKAVYDLGIEIKNN